ncbi:MAG: beta-ketoacyl-ACP synthase II [Deltaproteobacteria bacterium]|nr:beta-ketoacyl-ACP synthase II [Candidatus Anaeroferrophillus wilburensis]MBN2889039.1 beta-ketoacyl-ACP synthase II [Deltaproteobacteria bacterium]
MKRRVVVTGIGMVTPLGTGVEKSWQALIAGQSGIGPITKFDTDALATRIAGEVTDFDPTDFMPAKEVKRVDSFIQYGLGAAQMAMEMAQLTISDHLSTRTGVSVGAGLGGLPSLEHYYRILETSGPRRISPFFIPGMISNLAPGNISIRYNAKGPNLSVVTACATGSHSIGEGFKIIQRHDADIMITGGTESAITPLSVAGFNAMKALSTRNDDPEKASRPFDAGRDGFVMAEGAGVLILEALEFALDRGAPILAEITGYGSTADAHHVAAPAPGGEGAARAIQMALDDAGITPEKVDYVNAHGTSTYFNDLYETQALKKVFGDHACKLLISSSKSMTGHMLGGTGAVEAAITVLSLHRGMVHPTINLDNPDEGCDLNYVPQQAKKADLHAAISNSFGFGGTNACLAFSTYQE